MRHFAKLFNRLDQTHSTLEKVDALVDYFRNAPAADAAWAAWFLTGHRLKRFVKSSDLKAWLLEKSAIPDWLLEESYASVGDLGETIALLLGKASPNADPSRDLSLASWVERELLPLGSLPVEAQKEKIFSWWLGSDATTVFIVNKFLTGSFRIGVSSGLVVRAIATLSGVEESLVSRRLMGEWKPSAEFWESLVSKEDIQQDLFRPYPFYLASPLEDSADELGPVEDWLLEWKWDGIRAQWVLREGEFSLWSRGEELIAPQFPELHPQNLTEPLRSIVARGLVLDGEILAYCDSAPLPFQILQTRISRQKLTAKAMQACPIRFLVYDLLEEKGEDLRSVPLKERRRRLERLIPADDTIFLISPEIQASSWSEAKSLRDEARTRGVEGLMLKHRESEYKVGRRKGDWWKWKIAPLTLDMVLIYAHPGHGRRANLYTDYTFGVWNEDRLVPIAKAYSGLDQKEIDTLDRWIRNNTIEKFGPTRSVIPHHVFEIAFEGIAESKRHRSGIALRFPRILRWRHDKSIRDADTLASAQELLNVAK